MIQRGPRSSGPSITDHQLAKFPANSLLFVENSLLGIQKFPAPLRREFGCKPMDSLAEWRRKSSKIPCKFLDCTPCVRHENWEQFNQHIQQRYAGVEE